MHFKGLSDNDVTQNIRIFDPPLPPRHTPSRWARPPPPLAWRHYISDSPLRRSDWFCDLYIFQLYLMSVLTQLLMHFLHFLSRLQLEIIYIPPHLPDMWKNVSINLYNTEILTWRYPPSTRRVPADAGGYSAGPAGWLQPKGILQKKMSISFIRIIDLEK